MQPILSDFRAKFSAENVSLELCKVYGANPSKDKSKWVNLIDIKTLFFSEASQGGGAIIAVFKLH